MVVLDNGVETTVTLAEPFTTEGEGIPPGQLRSGPSPGYNASAGSCSDVAAAYREPLQGEERDRDREEEERGKKGGGGGGKGDKPSDRVASVFSVRLEPGTKGPPLAQIFRDGRWRKLGSGDKVGIGDRIRTLQNARMTVELDLGGRIELGRGMEIKIQKPARRDRPARRQRAVEGRQGPGLLDHAGAGDGGRHLRSGRQWP